MVDAQDCTVPTENSTKPEIPATEDVTNDSGDDNDNNATKSSVPNPILDTPPTGKSNSEKGLYDKKMATSVSSFDNDTITALQNSKSELRCNSVFEGPVTTSKPLRALIPRRNSDETAAEKKKREKHNDPKQFKPTKTLDSFSAFVSERIAVHKRGFIFKKAQKAEVTLSFTRSAIKQPMTVAVGKEHKKLAVEHFKSMQIYMGDRGKTAVANPLEVARQLAVSGFKMKQMRDELFMQVAKQMRNNPERKSIMKGWELFVIFLSIFPPSQLFSDYIEVFLGQHIKLEGKLSDDDVEVNTYASFCVQKLRRMTETGMKRGTEPKIEEISFALQSVMNPSMFGCTIADCLSLQAEQYPERHLPWFLLELTKDVLEKKGLTQEGIFRVPGDVDDVNALKLSIDQGKFNKDFKDPGVAGSLLKFYFRDLHEPLIPADVYEKCLANSTNIAECIEIVDNLPQDNRLIMYFIINFLQKFAKKESSDITFMTTENLAMVWAPNFVRCPSDDPLKILEMNKQEKAFVATLIENLNTVDIEEIK